MKKNRFLKIYRYVFLPLFLMIDLWLLIGVLTTYGLPNPSVPFGVKLSIIITEIVYFAYAILLINLIIRFIKMTLGIYYLNMIVLFTMPALDQIETSITQAIFNAIGNNYMSSAPFLSYILVYLIIFCPFFLPQVIYFKKRKYLFGMSGDINHISSLPNDKKDIMNEPNYISCHVFTKDGTIKDSRITADNIKFDYSKYLHNGELYFHEKEQNGKYQNIIITKDKYDKITNTHNTESK